MASVITTRRKSASFDYGPGSPSSLPSTPVQSPNPNSFNFSPTSSPRSRRSSFQSGRESPSPRFKGDRERTSDQAFTRVLNTVLAGLRVLRPKRPWIIMAALITTFIFSKPPSLPFPQGSSVPLLFEQLPLNLQSMHRALGRSRPNPLHQYAKPAYDGKIAVPDWPSRIRAKEMTTVTFRCSHTDVANLCPSSYRLLFQGPTMSSPLHSATHQVDGRTVEVQFSIRDPGNYTVRIWPEHEKCDQWANSDNVWNKKMVGWEQPFELEVVGPIERESSKQCARGFVPLPTDGRWISKAHLRPEHSLSDSSPHSWWLQPHLAPTSEEKWATTYSHFFAHHGCKVPHHTIKDWIELIKPSNLVIFGDSVLRDFFCLILYPALDGPQGGSCTFAKDSGYQTTDKMLDYPRQDGAVSRLRFKWLPKGEVDKLEQQLAQLEEDPSHVLIGISLWMAKESLEVYEARMTHTLSTLASLTPASTKILVRNSAGSVQAIQCYDRITPGGRRTLEAMNERLMEVVRSTPKVELFDVYPVCNNHPASSSDGRHWAGVGKEGEERPEVGACEFALLDQMFWKWMN
ncbi:hypothetical protein T439DRAFT_345991 [Meredithblackwellia eburnea MCA 4105]